MPDRIERRPDLLAAQLTTATSGINGEPNWPPQAPTAAVAFQAAADINNAINAVTAAEATLLIARQSRDNFVLSGRDIMKDVDAATDLLYGPTDARKANFGLTPLQSGGPPPPPPGQIVILRITDGISPSSIFIDWEAQDGAASYEVEWFTSSTLSLASRVGNATVTQSEFTATGLTAGTQYWFHARAIRASQTGPWSDPSTRVAGI